MSEAELCLHQCTSSRLAPDLGLVADHTDAPWVHERDDPVGVVPRQELCGYRHPIHVHAHRGAGHLKQDSLADWH